MTREISMATAPAPIPRRNLLSLCLSFFTIGPSTREHPPSSAIRGTVRVNNNDFSRFSSNRIENPYQATSLRKGATGRRDEAGVLQREQPSMQSERIGDIQARGQSSKHRLYTFTVGICATGQPPTLKPLLEMVLSSEIPGFSMRKVVLVASDCSERTLRVAREAAARDRRLRLVEHGRRTGKADAMNEIFRETEGDFLVYVNADAMIDSTSIPAILTSIARDKWVGFVSGRPVFARPGGMISDVLDTMWSSFDLLSSDPYQSAQRNHGTDELMVIRSELLPELPLGVVNDGAYIAGRIRETGMRIAFQPDAVVHIDVPRR